MVLELVLIGVAITLGPLHNIAFILLLSGPSGVRKGWRSSWPGSAVWCLSSRQWS